MQHTTQRKKQIPKKDILRMQDMLKKRHRLKKYIFYGDDLLPKSSSYRMIAVGQHFSQVQNSLIDRYVSLIVLIYKACINKSIYTLKKGVLIFVQILTHLLVCFITHLLVCLATHLKVCLTHLSLSQHTLRCAEKHTLGVLNTP